MENIRIDKFLASQNIGTRSEVGNLIKKGKVSIDGVVVLKRDSKLNPESCEVKVLEKLVTYRKHIYIMMHKPAGVISAAEDQHENTVIDLLPAAMQRRGLFPAGRLDRDSTGLLIITDDGDFAHKMLSPKFKVNKIYRVQTKSKISPKLLEQFAVGITYKAQKYDSAGIKQLSENTCEVTISEGKFHQVKRMFKACENGVVLLKRIQIGMLKMDPSLLPGEARLMEKEESFSVFL